MSLYRTILSQAWKTTWRHKYLWFFGLFATFLGAGGEYNVLFRGFSGNSEQQIFPGFQRIAETGVFSGQTLVNIEKIMKNDPFSLLTLLMVFLVVVIISIFMIWLSVVSQAALVDNSAKYLANKKVDFKSGIAAGAEKFWPVFGLNLVVKFLVYLIFGLVGWLVILSAPWPIFALIFVIFIVAALSLSFIIKYSVAYVVIKGSGFIESIKNGWRLFINNWLVSLEMAIILFFINLLAGLAVVLIVLTLTIPFMFLVMAVYQVSVTAGFWLMTLLAIVLLLGIIVLSGAVLSVFQISSWTGLFIRLIGKGGTSKIIRIANNAKKKISA